MKLLRKEVLLFVALFITLAFIPIVGATGDELQAAPLNPEFIRFMEKPYDPQGQGGTHGLGLIPSPIYRPELRDVQMFGQPTGNHPSSYPATFDLRTSGKVSPVKNQGTFGTCWAFATYGSLESTLMPNTPTPDFSEKNLANLAGFDLAIPNGGGQMWMSTAYLTRWNGPVNEATDPYPPGAWTSSSTYPPVKHIQNVVFFPPRTSRTDTGNIKEALTQWGAVYSSLFWDNSFYNDGHSSYYQPSTAADPSTGVGHAVTIIGWDDNYAAANFNTAAAGPGAWIVKNSWGSTWGNGGYFYVSYYDKYFGSAIPPVGYYKDTAVFLGESTSNYDTVYSYDKLGEVNDYRVSPKTGSFANVFTATTSGTVKAIGFYTTDLKVPCNISIYKNPTSGPVGGTPAATFSQTLPNMGYNTIIIPTSQQVPVTPSDKFSVVIQVTNPKNEFYIPVEENSLIGNERYTSGIVSQWGQGYVLGSSEWVDLKAELDNSHICVKAYTGPASPVADFNIVPPTTGSAPFTVRFADNSTGLITSYAWDFTNDGTTDSTVKNPTYTYRSAGTYSVNLTVTGLGGSSSKVRSNCITVFAPPIANFTANKTSGFSPLSIQFTGTSTGSLPLTYQWNFGDGEYSPLQNPTHIFSAIANTTYNVTLTASNSVGSSSKSSGITVNVNPAVIPPSSVKDLHNTTYLPTSITWTWTDPSSPDFEKVMVYLDDAFQSNVTKGVQTFTASTLTPDTRYTIATHTVGTTGLINQTSVNHISRTAPVAPATGSISIQSNPTGAKIFLDDADTGFTTPKTISNVPIGNHVIRCSLVGYVDNSKTTSMAADQTTQVSIDLVKIPTSTGSIFVQSNPTGAKIYLDDADTGFITPKTISNVPTGNHVIRCSLVGYVDNSQTVSVAADQTTDVMITLQKSGNIAPKADFSASIREGGKPLLVQFTDKSTNSPTSWYWVFGDGSTSNVQNPAHTYVNAGSYSVKLKVSNQAGIDALTRSGYITVTDISPTTGSIFVQSNPMGAKIFLDDADTGFITPKTISNVPTGNHVIRCSLGGYYDNAKTISVAADQTTPVSIDLVKIPTSTGSIFVQSNPTGAKIYLDDADTGFITPKTITNVPTGNHVIRCSLVGYYDNSRTVSVAADQTTDIMITLQKSGNIAPKADFLASIREGGKPLLVQFTDISTNSPTSWYWVFGDGSTSNVQNPAHIYANAGSYSVKLKVSNMAGTDALSRSNYIVVS